MILHDRSRRAFGSDNHAGVHPEVLTALAEVNEGHQVAYGADCYTARLREVLTQHFATEVEVFPVFTGTGANVIALQAMLPPWGAIICADCAHVFTDESTAPQRVAGMKLLPVPAPDGKIRPEALEIGGLHDEHRATPVAVTLTQSTELGTCYTPQEIAAIADRAHELGLRVHVDGARIANAAAHLELPLRAFTTDVGVDLLSLGGTKNGALGAEAVVVLNPEGITGLRELRKIDMQLASKMRFVSAQLLALFEGDLWLRSARHANAMAARLGEGLAELQVRICQPVQANGVFAVLPPATSLRDRFGFYDWDGEAGEVRLMCAFDTTAEDVDALVGAVAAAVRASRP